MSRSRKNPIGRDLYRHTICCQGDCIEEKWKRQYNRDMRRKNNQHVKQLEKLDEESIEDHEEDFISKPNLTTSGNEWNSPGDGYQLIHEENDWKKPHQMRMK